MSLKLDTLGTGPINEAEIGSPREVTPTRLTLSFSTSSIVSYAKKEGKNVKNVKKYWPITYRKVRRPLALYGKVQYDGTKLNNVTLGVTLDTGHKIQET